MGMPGDGEKYVIIGFDRFGRWSMTATCVHYKSTKSLSKTQKKFGYRWIGDKGHTISPVEVEEFKLINPS